MRKAFLGFVACTAAALSLSAQQPQDQQNGGWRKFGTAAPDTQADTQAVGEQGPAPAAAHPADPAPDEITVPAGTWVTVRINEVLSSNQNRVNDGFTATLAQPIIAQGLVVARRGQTIGGRVVDVQKAGFIKGTSRLGMELTELSLADGQQIPMRSDLVQYAGGASKGRDATAIGTTTGLGAAIGAAADGGFGAGVGAAAGAAASVIGVLVTRGRQTIVYPEDTLTFRTLEPLTVSTATARQAFLPAQPADYESPRQLQPRRTVAARPPVAAYPYPYGGLGWGYGGPWELYPGYGYGFGGPRIIVSTGFGRFGGFGRGRFGRRW